MPRSNKNIIVLSLSAAVLAAALTACSSTERPSAPQKEPAVQSPAPTPIPTKAPSPSPATGSDTKGTSPAPSNSPSDTTQSDDTKKFVLQIMEQAKKGKVPGNEYAAHTSLIDQVEKDWGKADKTESAGNGIYSTYDKHKAAFGFNKGSLIFDVRSYDTKLQTLSFSQIKSALGQPNDTIENKTETIYVYTANDQYQLKFIIPSSSGKVDHISVYSPQDAKNNMAG
ncbi:DUF4309 domain-containing protein [Paenibacillus sp. UNC451MF]|uniref:DUF4309 domain-containing protein n=1 Tax=Paenibacillus sp. UNC451MF TaxID=1449063 RepID=UPI00048C7171|nr:DUF4309 domain-containing protein [Paenibacillus sp. UNC451MF]